MAIFNTVYGGEWKWKPWANTIAYYPLKSWVNDGKWSGTLYNLTNSWIIFGDLWWVTCANFNGSSYASGSFYAYGTWNFTASVWGYRTSNNQWVRRCMGVIALVMNSKDWYVEWTSAPTPLNTWTNIVFTITWGRLKIYSNGTLYLDTNFSNNLPWTLYLGENDAGSFKLNWWLSELIFENVAWTQQEIQDYYDLTKWNYGL
jgi:hypothetical protein